MQASKHGSANPPMSQEARRLFRSAEMQGRQPTANAQVARLLRDTPTRRSADGHPMPTRENPAAIAASPF